MTDYQNQLFPYAYNILGSVDDALDVIQDVMEKRLSGVGGALENERAYLIKSVINRAINLKNRNKRMSGEGTWLPEPVATEAADAHIKKREIISYSILVLLEHLNARERAVFILKEAFDYSHEEIAETLSITVENSRQLLSRAKRSLARTDMMAPHHSHQPAVARNVHPLHRPWPFGAAYATALRRNSGKSGRWKEDAGRRRTHSGVATRYRTAALPLSPLPASLPDNLVHGEPPTGIAFLRRQRPGQLPGIRVGCAAMQNQQYLLNRRSR